MNDLSRARAVALAAVRADSRQPCDCIDCDARWCVHCLTHHGRKSCPIVEDYEAEA